MPQIQKGTTYADVSPDNLVTSANLNAHVDDAILLPGAITGQTPIASMIPAATAADDLALVADTSNASHLVNVPLADLVPASSLTASQMTEANRQTLHQYAAGTLSGGVYTVTLSPALGAYTAGVIIRFTANSANAGAVDVNVSALGVKNLLFNGSEELPANFIRAGQVVTVIYDGTNFQITSPGWKNYLTGDQFAATGTSIPNAFLPTGALTQEVTTSSTTPLTTAATFPDFTSKPEITEGAAYDLNTAITPKSATNILEIEVFVPISMDVAVGAAVAALFWDGDPTYAIAIGITTQLATGSGQLLIKHRLTAGTTSPVNFSVRVGNLAGAGTTIKINSMAGYTFGGLINSRLTIKEYVA